MMVTIVIAIVVIVIMMIAMMVIVNLIVVVMGPDTGLALCRACDDDCLFVASKLKLIDPRSSLLQATWFKTC